MNKIIRILSQEFIKLKENRKYRIAKPFKAYRYLDSLEFITEDNALYGVIYELSAGYFIVPIADLEPENVPSKDELEKVRKIIRTMIVLYTEYYFHDVMDFFCTEILPDRIIHINEFLLLFEKYKNERNLKLN
ncbi:hypothetical protein J2S72_000788 [Peptoniphilus koenoeneniae]|uniref:Immunity protein 63 domain-containing protein n=1 Tax=Peptoniphilus koenoeneniae TaxID=507751 RepID=A0ABU0AU26_9FIRM|nr:hypothetical protein [Peptoniphilus koenoeneniae]MDQ0274771.1 hypothetical protein [Peptoniphilus koenoeneniae]